MRFRTMNIDFFDAVERVTADGGHVVAHNARFDAQVVTNTAESCGLARDLRAEDCLCNPGEPP